MDLEIRNIVYETTIEDLPDELLVPIFYNLTADTLEKVGLVSERWKNVISEEIGQEIFVTDFANSRLPNCRTPRKLGEEVVKTCHVRMITGRIAQLKKPDKLKVLYFKAPVSSHVFKTLTCKAINLTKLYFLHSSLSVDTISKTITYPLSLPNLKLLHLCDRSLESGDRTVHLGFAPKNINFFLQQYFASLQELVISTVSDRVNTRTLGVNLLYFVQKHYKTLRTLKVSVASTILGVQMFFPNILDQYESIKLTREERFGLEWNKLSQVSFKSLELDFGKNFLVGLSEWTRILECQNSVQSAFLFKEAPVPHRLFGNLILRSCENLVYLQIGVQIIDEDLSTNPLDCSLFEVCRGLRKFGICGNGGPDRPLQTELINCHNLPKTILALMLRNIFVESGDLEMMIFRLNYVVKLTLDTVGNKEQFGMTLQLVDKIMAAKKCLEMVVKTFNNIDAIQYPDLVNEFEKESFTIETLQNCHFHTKFNDELNQYIFICV